MAFADFDRYWVGTHGPIAAQLPGLRRLVINLLRPELQRRPPPWDGLSCAWFESTDAVRSVVSTPEFRTMIDDEDNFVDTTARHRMIVIPHSATGDEPAASRSMSNTIKTVVPIWRKQGIEREYFNSYWRDAHARLICDLPNLHAYVQNTVRMDMQRLEPYCDAIAECWWTSWDGVLAAVNSDAYAAVQADEKHFADIARLVPMVVREVEIVRDGKRLID